MIFHPISALSGFTTFKTRLLKISLAMESTICEVVSSELPSMPSALFKTIHCAHFAQFGSSTPPLLVNHAFLIATLGAGSILCLIKLS
jgi:hypothetical protein